MVAQKQRRSPGRTLVKHGSAERGAGVTDWDQNWPLPTEATVIVLDFWCASAIIPTTPDFSIKSKADQVIRFQGPASLSPAKLD